MDKRVLGIADSGATVTVAAGMPIEIHLPETPTTGYRWQIEPIQGLEVDIQDAYVPAGSAIGAGGERIFTLTPKSAGSANVSLALRRSWEPPEKALQRYTLSIVAG